MTFDSHYIFPGSQNIWELMSIFPLVQFYTKPVSIRNDVNCTVLEKTLPILSRVFKPSLGNLVALCQPRMPQKQNSLDHKDNEARSK